MKNKFRTFELTYFYTYFPSFSNSSVKENKIKNLLGPIYRSSISWSLMSVGKWAADITWPMTSWPHWNFGETANGIQIYPLGGVACSCAGTVANIGVCFKKDEGPFWLFWRLYCLLAMSSSHNYWWIWVCNFFVNLSLSRNIIKSISTIICIFLVSKSIYVKNRKTTIWSLWSWSPGSMHWQ